MSRSKRWALAACLVLSTAGCQVEAADPLTPTSRAQASSDSTSNNAYEASAPDARPTSGVSVSTRLDTPELDARLNAEMEHVQLAAALAEAMEKQADKDRAAGKSFNEVNLGWSFACDESIHGIALLEPQLIEKLVADQQSSVCSCVKDRLPDNVEYILGSSQRSLAGKSQDDIDEQDRAFRACYTEVTSL